MEKKVNFSLSLLFFWVKGFVSVDSRLIKVSGMNTLLGFIPVGKDNQSIPLKNVSSTTLSTSYRLKRMIIGLIIILFSVVMMTDTAGFIAGLFYLSVGVIVILSGILSVLVIERAGSDYFIPVPFYDRSKLVEAQNYIEEALEHETDKTDLNMFFDKKES
ncbi:hypothetical protein [Salisediminibacterium beveridgei]|uniref:Uncharacterized protein n=1 Tax=Salisediminibacterium beveridgei TaxID=632773 RepID=A0A1D7QRU3_9BACI|nr:hypothetical protein [Salisediminibacterium beveridgei]AOM81709.1 hypothetical protein BBEV_0315 [Salisediminibacterium beveridgei]